MPGGIAKFLHGTGFNTGRRHTVFGSKFGGELLNEGGDFVAPFAQGRKLQIDNGEAEKEIFSERTVADHLLQVAVGGGDEAEIAVNGLSTSDAFKGAGFEDTEQLDLSCGIDFADFVKKNGTFISEFKLS